jgi:hypothetical protein
MRGTRAVTRRRVIGVQIGYLKRRGTRRKISLIIITSREASPI